MEVGRVVECGRCMLGMGTICESHKKLFMALPDTSGDFFDMSYFALIFPQRRMKFFTN